jgi:apolipoprotein D and lipocalin family protein
VVSGEFDSQKLVKKHSLTSVFGAPLSISAKGSVGINNAEVIIKDVTASNGIIHAIDSVILPGKRSSKFLDQRAFETNAYLGLWNDFARTPNNFQDNTPSSRGVEYSACFDSTALYTLKNAEKIDLVNTCYRRGSDGSTKVEDIKGRANVKGTRKLKVAFGGFILRGIQRIFTKGGADYWIYGVGAKNEEGLYSWALVSGPEKDYIFVLTRDKRVTKQQRNEILSLATLEGLPVDKLIFDEDR